MERPEVEFGYNVDIGETVNTTWSYIGTKYNFNVKGEILGTFNDGEKDILLSRVTQSFGDDCMAGTIDAREVIAEDADSYSYFLLCDNDPSMDELMISKVLSSKDVLQELKDGKKIEETIGFKRLSMMGIELGRISLPFSKKVVVCGLEKGQFERLKMGGRIK